MSNMVIEYVHVRVRCDCSDNGGRGGGFIFHATADPRPAERVMVEPAEFRMGCPGCGAPAMLGACATAHHDTRPAFVPAAAVEA